MLLVSPAWPRPGHDARQRVQLAHEAVVEATRGQVYACIAVPSRRPAWLRELRAVEPERSPVGDTGHPNREASVSNDLARGRGLVDGAVVAGDRFAGRAALLGHELLGRSEVVVAEADATLVEDVVIGARFTSSWTLDEVGVGRTRVRHVVEIDFPRGPLGLAARLLLGWRLRAMQRSSLRALAEQLEPA